MSFVYSAEADPRFFDGGGGAMSRGRTAGGGGDR